MKDDVQTLAPASSLRLLDFQHHGQALRLVWEWPAHAQLVGFDEIMTLVNDVSPWLNQMRFCSMTRTGSASQPMWWLGIRTHEMACSVNGQRLAVGQQVRLNHGDEIVLGLTRCAVELDRVHPSRGVAGDASSPSPDHLDDFELTELDALMDTTGLSASELERLDRSAFGDLISLNPEQKVIPAPGAVAMPSLVQPPATPKTVLEPAWEPAPATPQTADPPTPPTPAGPLEALHAEYLLRLHDPNHVQDQHSFWRDVVRRNQSSDTDPLQDLMDAAGTHPSLDDLLGQSQNINHVLAGLDTLSHRNVLEPEAFENVIRLFASGPPRVDVLNMTESIETLVQRSLPGLTRREHHSMSLDSNMPFFRSETPAQTKS